MPHHLQPPPPLDPADWVSVRETPVSVIPPAQARAVLDEAGVDVDVMDDALDRARLAELTAAAEATTDRVALALEEAQAALAGLVRVLEKASKLGARIGGRP